MRSLFRTGALLASMLPLGAIVGCGGEAPTIENDTPAPVVEPGQVDPGPPTAAEGGAY
ncbi:hypothetical protein [Tautonia marina]|uniref:hypothetical protein n=1 Tax=Tautonia marina TaxID=2653855 RepID=UPI0013757852|nr:hypothetical protein [Tautonia marina]